jgi:hypothetical protein
MSVSCSSSRLCSLTIKYRCFVPLEEEQEAASMGTRTYNQRGNSESSAVSLYLYNNSDCRHLKSTRKMRNSMIPAIPSTTTVLSERCCNSYQERLFVTHGGFWFFFKGYKAPVLYLNGFSFCEKIFS